MMIIRYCCGSYEIDCDFDVLDLGIRVFSRVSLCNLCFCSFGLNDLYELCVLTGTMD